MQITREAAKDIFLGREPTNDEIMSLCSFYLKSTYGKEEMKIKRDVINGASSGFLDNLELTDYFCNERDKNNEL